MRIMRGVKLTGIAAFLLVVLIAVLAAGCGRSGTGTGGKDAYKIGAVLDITGSSSSLGVPERNTLEMLAAKVNAAGGINGRPLEMIILDNKSDETEAVLAVKKLINTDKVLAVIGASSSGPSMAMLEVAQKEGVPMISLAAASKIVEPASERKWVFKTAQSDLVTVSKLVSYLKEKGISRVAFLYMNNAYGDGGRAAFAQAAQKAGIEVALEEKFEAGDKDMTPQLSKVKAAGVQAAVVWAIPPSASIVTKNFRDMGLSIPLLHSHGAGNQNFIDLCAGAAEGVILPLGRLAVAEQIPASDPQKAVLDEYRKDYRQKYGEEPSSFGGYAHDAFWLLAKALEKAGADRAAVRGELEKISVYVGVSGIFRLSPEDHNGLGEDSLVLVTVKNGRWALIE